MMQPLRSKILPLLLVIVIAFGASYAWEKHNQTILGESTLSATGATVLAIRAAHDTMTWREYTASYIAFLPELGAFNLRQKLLDSFFTFEVYSRFRDVGDKEFDFYGGWTEGVVGQRAKNETGQIDPHKVKGAALSVIKERWVKHIALIPVFAWRGSFVTVGFLNAEPDSSRPEKIFKAILRYGTMAYYLLFYSELLVFFFFLEVLNFS